jgi:hypothetical protein
MVPARTTPPLGRNSTNQHPLATAHHTHLGRTTLRIRRRPRLRRTHRKQRRRINDHIHPSRPARSRHRPSRLDPRTTPPCRTRTPSIQQYVTTGAVTLPATILTTWSLTIYQRWVTEQMDQSRSRRIILLVDCCYIGAFSGILNAGAPMPRGYPSSSKDVVE